MSLLLGLQFPGDSLMMLKKLSWFGIDQNDFAGLFVAPDVSPARRSASFCDSF